MLCSRVGELVKLGQASGLAGSSTRCAAVAFHGQGSHIQLQ